MGAHLKQPIWSEWVRYYEERPYVVGVSMAWRVEQCLG